MLYRTISNKDITGIHQLYKQEGWNSYTLELVGHLKDQSQWVIAEEEGIIRGFARYITDNVLTIYLCDIIVDPSFRGKHIGKTLIDEIFKENPGLRIDLASFEDGFYEKIQFRPIGNAYRSYGSVEF